MEPSYSITDKNPHLQFHQKTMREQNDSRRPTLMDINYNDISKNLSQKEPKKKKRRSKHEYIDS